MTAFPWHEVGAAAEPEWRRLFRVAGTLTRLEVPCPECGTPALRRYLRAAGPLRRGHEWQWCGSCFAFLHTRGRVPAWWGGDHRLDRVPGDLLGHEPEALERALRAPGDTMD